MGADFEAAVRIVLSHEGGLADNRKDPGGITNHGISLRFLRQLGSLALGDVDHDGDIDPDDIRKMTVDQAKLIYRTQWWDRYGYAQLSQRVATKIFDHAVNLGPFMAHKLAQRAVGVADDGRLGPVTVGMIMRANETEFMDRFKALLEQHYRLLVQLHPDFAQFLAGWVRRSRLG